jgi:hypothetical protein
VRQLILTTLLAGFASVGCNGVPLWKWALIGTAMFAVLYFTRGGTPKRPGPPRN